MSEQPPFGEWFDGFVEVDPAQLTPATDFYRSYTDWCARHGILRPMSQTAFGVALTNRGLFRAGKDSLGRFLRRGGGLRTDIARRAAGHPGVGQRDTRTPFAVNALLGAGWVFVFAVCAWGSFEIIRASVRILAEITP